MKWRWPTIVLLLLANSVMSQSLFKGVRGKVYTQDRMMLGAVNIILHDIRTGEQRRTLTDRQGTFSFSCIPDGEYRLTLSVDGCLTQTIENIKYSYPQDYSLSIQLVHDPIGEQFASQGELVVIELVDAATTSAISEATIIGIGEEAYQRISGMTDICGKIGWRLKPGNYRFEISKTGYKAIKVSYPVRGPRFIQLELSRELGMRASQPGK